VGKEYLAVVPVHGRATLVEGRKIKRVRKEVAKVLEEPKRVYPNYDFEGGVVLFKGEKLQWRKKT